MNTLHLKYIVEIEHMRSISRAADNLHIAQPNLSKAIRELEDNMGFAVFERTSRGVIPTVKGKEFLIYARNILDQLERMESLSGIDNSGRQNFNISIPSGSYITDGFAQFASELNFEKEININIQETNSLHTINSILDGRFHLGIIRYQLLHEDYFMNHLADKNLFHDDVWEFEYVALLSKKHILASRDTVLFDELSQFTEIIFSDAVIPVRKVWKGMKDSRREDFIQKKILLYERCNQFDLLSRLPTTYMLASPVPGRLLELYGLVQRRCDFTNNKYKDLLIYPKGYELTELDKKFINKLQQSKDEVSSGK